VLVESGGTEIYWEAAGSGDPLLLVTGLGMPATGWWRTVPVLAKGFRVIMFDNRGSGRSGRPPAPYSIGRLAADALAVLDAADEASAHVYGVSLGGMVAQELALRAPGRVRSLVLGATTAGGRGHELPDRETVGFLRRHVSMPAEEGVWASIPYMYGPATLERRAERIAEDVERRLRFPPDRDGYRAQLEAAWAHDTASRLDSIAVPTLVLHGTADRIVPFGNGRRLAELLPEARFEALAGAGHLFVTDAPESADVVVRFLGQIGAPA
jgi:pimeloyl-ACP methyl ester carboxylesterase